MYARTGTLSDQEVIDQLSTVTQLINLGLSKVTRSECQFEPIRFYGSKTGSMW